MKILLTGAEKNLSKYIKDYFSYNNEIFEFTSNELKSSNKNICFNVITKVKPDILIDLETMDNIDNCETDESSAYTINTIGSLNMAYPCSILNIPIIYLSTSYVYSGNKSSSYFETDQCEPVNVYGKTKLAGEKLIRTLCKRYFIIRSGWIFGFESCFVKKIINNSSVPIFICSSEFGNPTYVGDLCNLIKEMLHSDLYGIYNCGNTPSISKSLWVKTIFRVTGLSKEIVEMPQNFIANSACRPKNSSLNTSLIKNCFNVDFPSWEIRLREYLDSIDN